MKMGPFWRYSRRALAVVAVVTGLTVLGLGDRAYSEEPTAPETKEKAADDAPAASGSRAAFIDDMIKEAWTAAGVKPSPICTDEEYMRRAYLDVLGRIPTIDEASAFLGSKEKGKRSKLVEYLLNQPDYAKNFANKWTVILVGRKRQERFVDRDMLLTWLRQQFNANRPWNEMAYELITAKGSNKENGAVNFALSHLEMGAVPLTSVTARVFLGQQIQCTQCHDHPSNDWKQADFWGINAFFKGMKMEEIRKEDATGAEVLDHTELSDTPTDAYSTYDKRNGLVGISFPRFLDGRKIDQGEGVDRRTELGKLIADPSNENFSKAMVNRMWGHFFGRGIVNPVDDFGAHNPATHPEMLDQLGQEFKANKFDVKVLIRWIMNSQAYNLTSAMSKGNEKDETLFSHMALKPMLPEQLFDSLLTATAAHKAGGANNTDKQRDAWMRQFIFAFGNDEGEEGTTFAGTIPQALMMMNGELMEKAVNGHSGSFLNDLASRAMKQRKVAAPVFMVNNLYLAALSRFPTRGEMTMSRKFLEASPDTDYVLQDLFWALLNSNEFILNR